MENMAGLEQLRAQMNNHICEMVRKKIEELTNIWSDVGISYKPTRSRLERTGAHIANLLDQMLEGEIEMREKLLRNITEFRDQVQKLSVELSVPSPAIDDSLTMLEKENVIRERLEQLKQIKAFRKRERKKLRSKECELCTKLGMPALALSNASTPTENDLQELEQHVAQLEREKAVRSCTLTALRNSIIAKLSLLDLQPESQQEIQLVEDQEGFILSDSNIDEARAYLERLKQLEEARRRELAALLDQLALFFDRLDIPPEEQDRIRNTNSDLTPATMAALREQLAKYERQKRERLQEFIIRVKDEWLTWKKKCCLPNSVDDDGDCEDITEQHLAKLEDELKSLKDLYAEHKAIITKAERHEALWLRSLELEKLATDPARLMNRGGRLLLETKERQRLQTELPRLRDEIEKYIDTNRGRSDTFAQWGRDLLSHLEAQQTKHAEEKERERLERESRRKATPTKSSYVKRALCGTPSGTASRISRLGTSTATLGSSRRGATPASKNTTVAHGGTPVRAGAAAIAPAKSIRRRSLKAQKKSANGRQLFKGKGADEASTSTAGTVGELTSMDSFAHFLTQESGKHLTSSMLVTPKSQPETTAQATGADMASTLTEEQVPPS